MLAKLEGASRAERSLVVADKSHSLRCTLRAAREQSMRGWKTMRRGGQS